MIYVHYSDTLYNYEYGECVYNMHMHVVSTNFAKTLVCKHETSRHIVQTAYIQ